MVATGDTAPSFSGIGKRLQDTTGRYLIDPLKPAGLDCVPRPLGGGIDVIGRSPFVGQLRFEVVQMFTERPLAVFFKRKFYSRCPTFRLPHPFIEHGLCRDLVHGQRHPLLDAMFVAKTAPPFLGLRLDLLTCPRVNDDDRLFVQTRHAISSDDSRPSW